MVSDNGPMAIACDLGALSDDERTRRSALQARVFGRVLEVQETSDGYAARVDADTPFLHDTLDWILLERRCCPFLRIELRLDSSTGPVWLQFGGGPGVKEFLAAAVGKAPWFRDIGGY